MIASSNHHLKIQNRMSDKETKERIEESAKLYAEARGNGNDYLSYKTGAESERPKAWNEAIDAVKDMLVVQMEDEENEGLAALENAYSKLEELKHKQP